MIDQCYCYCVFGRDLIYYEPIKILAKKILSNPSAVIFLGTIDADVDFVSNFYKEYENIRIFCFNHEYHSRERLIRFMAPKYIEANYYHFRDSDSMVTDFEQGLILSYASLHYPILIIRNHPLHYSPIMAGMFSLNQDFGKRLVCYVEERLSSIVNKPYYDQIFLTNTLYKKYKSKALVFSSHVMYEGENAHKISFDKYDFIGRPAFWSGADCDGAWNGAGLLLSDGLAKLAFLSGLSSLYQRGSFIKLLCLLSKLRIWWKLP